MKINPVARLVSFSQDAPRSIAARPPGTASIAMVHEHEARQQQLTARELEVLALLCEGLPNKTIQRRLDIGAGTVKCHVGSILGKLGVASRLQAVVAAHRMGLLGGAGTRRHDDDADTYTGDGGATAWIAPKTGDGLSAAA